MTTIVRNIKIPGQAGGVKLSYEPGTQRLAEDQRLKPARSIAEMFGADAVTPSVRGRQGVTPSTIGIAAQKRFAELSKVAAVAAGGLDAILKIRDSEEAAANPELAALANDPKFIAVIARVVAKIGKEVNELTSGTPNEGTTKSSLTSHRMSQEERVHRSQALVAAGLDSACAFDAKVRAAAAQGAINPARVAAGLPDTPATADDLFALGREADWKHAPRG